MHPYRTHNCNEITKDHVGQEIRLSGWVHRKRDHGQLLFIDLRDHYGLTQLVTEGDAMFDELSRVRNESVITVTGKVVARTEDTVNPEMPTGEVEVVIDTWVLESNVETEQLPVRVNSDDEFPRRSAVALPFPRSAP